jgi:hypothetical protein
VGNKWEMMLIGNLEEHHISLKSGLPKNDTEAVGGSEDDQIDGRQS